MNIVWFSLITFVLLFLFGIGMEIEKWLGFKNQGYDESDPPCPYDL